MACGVFGVLRGLFGGLFHLRSMHAPVQKCIGPPSPAQRASLLYEYILTMYYSIVLVDIFVLKELPWHIVVVGVGKGKG